MAQSQKQLRLFKQENPCFGGSLLKGNPRKARPLSTKRPVHLVLKSKMATGPRSMLGPRVVDKIRNLVYDYARTNGVRVYHYANGGNHLHLLIKIDNLQLFRKYLRVVSGMIARLVLKAEKHSKKLKANERFWQARPFTRVAFWGKAYDSLVNYLGLNKFEALGFIPHQARGRKAKGREFEVITIKCEPSPDPEDYF